MRKGELFIFLLRSEISHAASLRDNIHFEKHRYDHYALSDRRAARYSCPRALHRWSQSFLLISKWQASVREENVLEMPDGAWHSFCRRAAKAQDKSLPSGLPEIRRGERCQPK